ncbi:hypothetical protein HWB79_gp037 [Streptomyces phage LukeCage]|jgi:hypothetical protein|uniref:Uncharacterized protein n=2 Tax=Karimacvirus TaxID=2843400 RepID=A0A345M8G4_9CAUD|nr:hypothetical protein HWB77_gp036 [Streptomyces phage StarPlatinum]YP_009839962.1 hypothetical protein HWB79_gp037 [Streptomyces phage LukeCage]AXH66785.1 hypothetical protein SEA_STARPLATINUM_36 [Streptomyces phage StarPlatinum]AXH69564.1 hypothetical protein SEA_LUKECAGE_37 [Streptomyces phage LukeCage]
MPATGKSGNERNARGLCYTKYCDRKNLSEAIFCGKKVLFCPQCKEAKKYMK